MATARRILVVEEHADSRKMMLRLLSLEGWEAEGATGVREAIGRMDNEPDCILMGWRFPDGEATEIVEVALWHLPNVRIVVLSGRTDARGPDSLRYAYPGVDAILIKGCEPNDILRAVECPSETMVRRDPRLSPQWIATSQPTCTGGLTGQSSPI